MNSCGNGEEIKKLEQNKKKGISRNVHNKISKTQSMISPKSTMNYYIQRKETMGNYYYNNKRSINAYNENYYASSNDDINEKDVIQSQQLSASKQILYYNATVNQNTYSHINTNNNTDTCSNKKNTNRSTKHIVFKRNNQPDSNKGNILSIVTTHPKKEQSNLKRSNSQIDQSIYITTLKDKLKEYESILDKMYFDNKQLTKVNQKLLNELNSIKAEHACLIGNSSKEYNKINKENELLSKQLQESSSKSKGKKDKSRIQPETINQSQYAESNTFAKNLLTSLTNYKNQNGKYKQAIINLEATIEQLTKNHWLQSSLISDTKKCYNDKIIEIIERENNVLSAKVKALENTIISYQHEKNNSHNSMKGNLNHEDFSLYIKEKEMMSILYNLLNNFCLLLKKKIMPYEECLHKQKTFKKLIEAIEDDIRILFIKKNYGEMTEENAAILTESKDKDHLHEMIHTFSSNF